MGFEKTLVVKRIHPHLVEEQQFIEMFLSEAKLAAQLNHANVVQIFDFGEEEGSYFIAMEYIDGPSLHALIKRTSSERAPIAFPLCAKILSFACEGLAYAHELTDPTTGAPLGLIHRDISPDNILLSRSGGVKVVDFGIAKVANQGHHTKTGVVKGKVAYMSPEHLRGAPLDPRADVFALGVVLYKLVTSQHPFRADSEVSLIQAILNDPMVAVREHRQDVPQGLERIIEKALAKDREQRYGSCRELQADLERFLLKSGEPVGPAQIAELVKKLTPPDAATVAPVGPPPPPPAPMEAPLPTLPETPSAAPPRTLSMIPARQASPALPEILPAPEAMREADGPRRRLGWGTGLLLLVMLAGAGGYLGWRQTQQAPERNEDAEKVAPVPTQPPPSAVPETPPKILEVTETAVAPDQTPPVEEKAPATPPLSQPEAPALATFRVSSKPSGMVSVNGKRVGRSPVTVEVKPGKVNVSVAGDVDGERFDSV